MSSKLLTVFSRVLPSWLTEGEGGLVLLSLHDVINWSVERLRQGTLARFPSYAPPDAIPFIGRDRKIVRGINEPLSSYVARLLRWLDDHRRRGNPFALMDQLAAYCQADVRIRTVDANGNWFTRDRDGSISWKLTAGNWIWDLLAVPPNWSRFWVIIYPTAAGEPWAPASPAIGVAPYPWGGVIGTPGYTIGTTATPEQVATLRAIVRDWQPHGTMCEWIIIAFDDASFDPNDTSPPLPDGTWGAFGKYDGSGNYVKARLDSARYIRGVKGAQYPTPG